MNNWQDTLSPRAKERLALAEKEGKVLPPKFSVTLAVFKEAIKQRMAEKEISFILAIYQVLDEFVAKEKEVSGIVLACGKGCSYCCRQLITCTEIEIKEIVSFLNGLPRQTRAPLVRRIKEYIRQWQRYFELHEGDLQKNPFMSNKDWQGEDCPFLNPEDQSCDIYPVRIIDCRTASSFVVKCGQGIKNDFNIGVPLFQIGPGRCRFQEELFANNLIMEEQQRKSNLSDPRLVAVTPLLHWLCVKKKDFC